MELRSVLALAMSISFMFLVLGSFCKLCTALFYSLTLLILFTMGANRERAFPLAVPFDDVMVSLKVL